jgi:hypothetical protein
MRKELGIINVLTAQKLTFLILLYTLIREINIAINKSTQLIYQMNLASIYLVAWQTEVEVDLRKLILVVLIKILVHLF